MRRVLSGCGVLTAVAAATLAGAQTPPRSTSTPDSPQILQMMSGCTKMRLERRGAA